jgi:glyoxylase-like metal-dependent hydrolase (beta-lactamase superfamily II)
MKIHTIDTGFFKLDGGAMFGVVPKTIWQKLNPADANNLCTWAMRCLLVEDANRLILIDTGLGDKQSEKFFSYYEPHGKASLLSSIRSAGFSVDDVTDVILTHLHFDHCGGAVQRTADGGLQTVFKNATYWSHSKHWEWAVKPNPREKASFLSENILPIKDSGQLQFIDEQSSPIHQHIDIEIVSGHTESMILPVISLSGRKLLYCADLIPSMAHIPIPYVMGYDTRPLLTIEEKQRILRWAFEQKALLVFEHDREVECCNLIESERGIRQGEVMKIAEL